VLPTDTHGRRILAADRHELLRARPPRGGPAGAARSLLAGLLVGAAARLAPDASPAPRPRVSR
jgi:hypothetical protein